MSEKKEVLKDENETKIKGNDSNVSHPPKVEAKTATKLEETISDVTALLSAKESDTPEPTVVDAIADINSRLDELHAMFTEHNTIVEQLSNAVIGQGQLLKILDNRINFVVGEKVDTIAVPKTPSNKLEFAAGIGGLAFVPPTPSKSDITPPNDNIPRGGSALTQFAWQQRALVDIP